MTVIVTQTESENASHCVTLFVNGEIAGGVGPGESLAIKKEAPECEIVAVCGIYRESIKLTHDETLMIRWIATAKRMELVPAKK